MSTALQCILCETSWSTTEAAAHIEPCPGCGVPTTSPPPSRDVFSDELFFDGTYQGSRLARTEQWLREARTRVSWVERFVPEGRLLEVGSATGEFIHLAEQAGFEATGIEASAWAAEAAKRLTPSVVRAELGTWLAAHPEERFDAVVMFHTLEHVSAPQEFLGLLRDALAEGGSMFIEVPNGEARDLRDGPRWSHSSLAEHVVHYRTRDLEALLGSVGLQMRSVEALTMAEYDTPLVWALRRARWLSQGRLTPSADFLRVVASRV